MTDSHFSSVEDILNAPSPSLATANMTTTTTSNTSPTFNSSSRRDFTNPHDSNTPDNHIPSSSSPPSTSTSTRNPQAFPKPSRAARHAKRLTLNFPIVPPSPYQDPRGSPAPTATASPSPGVLTPTDSASARSSTLGLAQALQSPRNGAGTASGITSPTAAVPTTTSTNAEPANFLTALAAQERKVLELKEELARAEADLENLKRHWAIHEASRKKQEIRTLEKVRPLSTTVVGGGYFPQGLLDGEREKDKETRFEGPSKAQRPSREEKRASFIGSPGLGGNGVQQTPRNPARKVFEGSRHTRTLSLLSPGLAGERHKHSFSQPTDIPARSNSGVDGLAAARAARSSTLPLAETSPSVGPIPNDTAGSSNTIATLQQKEQWRHSLPMPPQPPSRDVLLRTGKQMASDFREGLWTFLEDIRQATVGEEGISGTENRTSALHALNGGTAPGALKQQRSREALAGIENPAGPLSRTSSTAAKRRSGVYGSSTGTKSAAPQSTGDIGFDAESSFWKEFGLDSASSKTPSKPEPARTRLGNNALKRSTSSSKNASKANATTTPAKLKHVPSSQSLLDTDDSWDNWDSPVAVPTKANITSAKSQNKTGGHTPSSSASTTNGRTGWDRENSPRTSTSSLENVISNDNTHLDVTKDTHSGSASPALPSPSWSASLSKISPARLSKTANQLMADWERSLMESATDEKKSD